MPSGTLSATPDVLQLMHGNCKPSRCRTVAARTLSAQSSVCVRVRKSVKFVRRVARRNMNQKKTIENPDDDDCDETISS